MKLKSLFKDRRASTTGEQVMGIWFILLLVLIAGGLSVGILIYFGGDYDFRQAEAGILNYKIRQCLFYNSIDFSNEKGFYSSCGLSEKVLVGDFNSTKIAIKICKDNCDNGEVLYQLGSDFESCDFAGKGSSYMKCEHKKVTTSEGVFDVIVGSNHLVRRQNG